MAKTGRKMILSINDYFDLDVKYVVIRDDDRCLLYRNTELLGHCHITYCNNIVDEAIKHALHLYRCLWHKYNDPDRMPDYCSKAFSEYDNLIAKYNNSLINVFQFS